MDFFITSDKTNYSKATSYLSVEQTDKFMKSTNKKWTNLSLKKKQVVLNQASLYIDGFQSYQGVKTDADQLLEFPRNGDLEIDRKIMYSIFDIVIDFLEHSSFTRNIKSEKIDEVRIDFFQNKDFISLERYCRITSYLRPLRKVSIKINF